MYFNHRFTFPAVIAQANTKPQQVVFPLIFIDLTAVFSSIVMLSTAEQPQEKVFAACEVFRGGSYLGEVQPKTMVAL